MRESFKVSKEEYALINAMKRFNKDDFNLLNTLKDNKFTLADVKALERTREISEENKQLERSQIIKNSKMTIEHKQREIKYKQDQVDKKESLEKEDKCIDGKKPIFMLENEIERSEAEIEQIKEVIKATQSEYDAHNRN